MTHDATNLDHRFAQNLAIQREKKGLSKTELARAMQESGWDSYSQMTVSRTETESRKVGVAEAHALAQALGVPYSQLLQTGQEQQIQHQLDLFRQRLSRLGGLIARVLELQEEVARLIDGMGGEIPSRMRAEVEEALSWSAAQYVREEMAQHLTDEEAELGLLNHLEDGDTFNVYGPLQEKLRDRIAGDFERLKEVVDDGFDQEA